MLSSAGLQAIDIEYLSEALPRGSQCLQSLSVQMGATLTSRLITSFLAASGENLHGVFTDKNHNTDVTTQLPDLVIKMSGWLCI